MIVDDLGEVTGRDGTSNTLSSPLDRKILKLIRSASDLVIIGSRSVAAEGWHLPPHGLLAVVSRSHAFPPACPDPDRVRIGTLEETLELMHAFNRVVCEGGKSVAQQLLSRDAIDEICLTSNVAQEPRASRLPEWMHTASGAEWTMHSQFKGDGQAFTTWRRATV